MGIYQNLGFRRLALQIVDLINWVRLYQFKEGCKIFISLLHTGSEITVTMKDQNKIYLRHKTSDIAIFKQVFLEQQYRLFQFPLKDAHKIIDAGANVGLAAVYFTHTFPEATIISIEPEMNNYRQLEKNTAPYKNIYCEHAAIWGEAASVVINNPESLSAGFMVSANTVSINGNAIPAVTIDALMNKYHWQEIDIVKMDIEGAEKEVFAGNHAFEWLSKTKLLIIELHDHYIPGCSKTLFKALEPFAFEVFYHHENIFIHFNHHTH